MSACAPLAATLTTNTRWMFFSCIDAHITTRGLKSRISSERRGRLVERRWLAAEPLRHCEHSRTFEGRPSLDSLRRESYFPLIPIHRLPGGAFVRASVFRLGLRGFLATRWGGRRSVELKKDNEWLVLPGSTSPPTSASRLR